MRTRPIKSSDHQVTHGIDRTYRESGGDQYIRELLQNCLEAGARMVKVGPEWQAVERLGCWRFMIADDGNGRPTKLRVVNGDSQ
jgi:hypothetical protein